MTLVKKWPLAMAAVAMIVGAACADKDGAPSGPTTAATPTPAAPTPAPTPTPTPSPAALTCSLPANSDCGRSGCCRKSGTPQFDDEIAAAQAELRRTSPELFNSNGSLRVDEVTYTDALAKKITAMFGLCARGGGGGTSISRDEVAVKRDNSLSQNVDVILGASNTPYVGDNYTCTPASF
jgi:hypothetical protein